MVDAAASLNVERSGSLFQVSISASTETYHQLAKEALFAPPQDPAWIDCWTARMKSQALFATVFTAGQPVFSTALELKRSGLFTQARLMGGGHANGNFAPVQQGLGEDADRACMEALIAGIRAERPDIDVVVFERLEPSLRGRRNPLLSLPHMHSPNIALAVDLTPGFEKIVERSGGKRKRKRHRYQRRKFAAAGPIHLIRAENEQQVRQLLDAFFAMKAVRLQRLGVGNVFGSEAVRAFFRDLFVKAVAAPAPAFFLDALEVGGKIRAITGSCICADRLICDFAAFAEDELSIASPGEYLLHENIAAACRSGFKIYDLGVGDEPYKRSWCDLETHHFDVIVPLTMRGKLLAAGLTTTGRLKAAIKNSPLAWRLIKAIRSRRSGSQNEPEDE